MNRRNTPSDLVLINQIIEYKRGGMDYLNGGRGVKGLFRIDAEGFSRESDEKRAAALSTGFEHVPDYLVGFVSVKVCCKGLVDFFLNWASPTLELAREVCHYLLSLQH